MRALTNTDREFLTALNGKRADRASLAALRRGLGKRPSEVPELLQQVAPLLPADVKAWQEEQENPYYVIATLFAAWHRSAESKSAPTGPKNLGASFRKLKDEQESKRGSAASVEKRFITLLKSEYGELPGHLRHAVTLLRSSDIAINWAQLLIDLRHWKDEYEWSHDDRSVQRAWARAFWGEIPPETATEEQPEDAESVKEQ
jgi:CRISPR system Cascade subunit CasB